MNVPRDLSGQVLIYRQKINEMYNFNLSYRFELGLERVFNGYQRIDQWTILEHKIMN